MTATIKQAIESQPAQEPAGWQYRVPHNVLGWSEWRQCDDKYHAEIMRDKFDYQIRPIYAAPVQQSPSIRDFADSVIAAIEQKRSNFIDSVYERNRLFQVWWKSSGHSDAYNLVVKNACHAAWQEAMEYIALHGITHHTNPADRSGDPADCANNEWSDDNYHSVRNRVVQECADLCCVLQRHNDNGKALYEPKHCAKYIMELQSTRKTGHDKQD